MIEDIFIGAVIILMFGCCFFLAGLCIYVTFFRDKVDEKRISKAKILYPEFYQLLKKRDNIYNKFIKENTVYRHAEETINNLTKEMAYTPLESQSAMQMHIEILKKTRLEHKPLADKYLYQSKQLDEKIDKMIDDNKLLYKIYKGL